MADEAELLELMVDGRLQEGVPGPRDAQRREPARVPQAAEPARRPGRQRAHDPGGRARGHGRLHRRLRQRRSRHLPAPVRLHPDSRAWSPPWSACCRPCRAAGSTSAWRARAVCAAASHGDNTSAGFNFEPRLDRDFLVENYRRLMRRLYEPRAYYQRIRIFLAAHRSRGPRPLLTWPDLGAALRSLWVMGIMHRGRFAYWRFLALDAGAASRSDRRGDDAGHHGPSFPAGGGGALTVARPLFVRAARLRSRWPWRRARESANLSPNG